MESNLNKLMSKKNEFEFKKKFIISFKENHIEYAPSGVQDFDILSSLEEIRSREFNLVDKDCLISKDESSYIDKYVFNFEIGGKNYILFPKGNTVLEIDKTNKNIIQGLNEISSPSQNDKKVICKITPEEKKNRIRNIIQL